MLLSGADIIVRTLIEQGVEVVFGYPGGQIIDVYDSLYRCQDEIRHVLTAHEQGAVHAADGYARATGGVGTVIATSGPGATNLVTGIAAAFLDSVPLVAVTGNVPSDQLGTDSFQEIDITGITLPITKHNFIAGSVETLADTIREAFRLAKSGRPGPVLIDVPKDIQVAQAEFTPGEPVPAAEKQSRADVTEAVETIAQCNRPFVYFGGGVIASGAEQAVTELAEKIDAPIGCSLMGVSGVATEHPRFLGMQGMHGHYASSIAMHHADCIIACGVRFNDRATGDTGRFAQGAKVIHIDVDNAEFLKTVKAALCLKGDVGLTLARLTAALKKQERPDWWDEIRKFKAREEEQIDHREGLVPRNIYALLNDYLTASTPVVTDVGQHQMWAAQYLRFEQTRRFISNGGLGAMGFGMGAAIGAALGTGERTVLVTGDGGFGMCLTELATAVSNKVPLVILVINNGVLGMVRQFQTIWYDRHYAGTVLDRQTDFVAVAEAFGAKGARVRSLAELQEAFDTAFAADGPFLIDCAVHRDELVLPMLPPGGSMDDIIVKVED